MTATLPFVGRDREVALLSAALDATLSGQGALALISGEAGIGKTTLAELICNAAHERGALVLTGRCYDLTETAPFAPWLELFNSYPADDALPELPAAVAGCEIGGEITNQAALFAAVLAFLRDVARVRPLVLFFDDQHWADSTSLDLLRFVARQAPGAPLLILATYRSAELEPTHRLVQLLPLLAREAHAMRLNLQPLSSDEIWALVRPRYQLAAIDETHLTSYLYNRTEGNPFFASELLQTLEEDGVLRRDASGWALGDFGQTRTPVLIEHIIGARLVQLNAADRHILSIAAVLGQTVPFTLWSEVAETSRGRLMEVVDRANRARLLSETPEGYGARFTHALIRQVVYERIAPSRRRSWHQRAGTALAAMAVPDPDAVANHYQRSSDPRAAEWLIRAGERARRAYSWQAAAERFEAAESALSATGEDPVLQGWLLVQSARMRRYADPRAGLELLERARRIADATRDHALAGTILWQSGLLHCLLGAIQRGLELLEQGVAALATLTPAEEEGLRSIASPVTVVPDAYQDQGTLASWLAVAGRFEEAITYALPYLAETTVPDGAATYGDAYGALARSYAMLGRPEESRAAYARAATAYADIRHAVHLARSLVNELQVRVLNYATDDRIEIRRIEAEAETAWTRGSDALADSFTGAMRLPRQFVEGRWTQMRATALALRAGGTSSLRAEASYWLAPVARAQGDTELAHELVNEWVPGGPATAPGNSVYRTAQSMLRFAAELAVDAQDLPAARRWLEAGDRWYKWSGAILDKARHTLCWAAYQRVDNDLSAARQYAEIALQQASVPRQPLELVAVHRFLGELDTTELHFDAAEAHLNTALTLAEHCAAAYEQALTLLALVELELAGGNRGDAEAQLIQARATLAALNAQPALARAAVLADRFDQADAHSEAGATPPRLPAVVSADDRARLAELSARELDVLRLLPAGHTNREIADELFLSPKTIENHVGRILAKTGLPNRSAAAAFAQRVGLD